MLPVLVSTKLYTNFPCTHRQPQDDGHCRFIHGYSRSFYFEFVTDELEPGTKFVVHFGHLDWLKSHLDLLFDHTFLANQDDPFLNLFRQLHEAQVLDLRILPNVSMEGTATYLFNWVNEQLASLYKDRSVACRKVEVRENDKNSAYYKVDPLHALSIVQAIRKNLKKGDATQQKGESGGESGGENEIDLNSRDDVENSESVETQTKEEQSYIDRSEEFRSEEFNSYR